MVYVFVVVIVAYSPNHDACSGVKWIVSFGYLSACRPVNTGMRTDGNPKPIPSPKCRKFTARHAKTYSTILIMNMKAHFSEKRPTCGKRRRNFDTSPEHLSECSAVPESATPVLKIRLVEDVINANSHSLMLTSSKRNEHSNHALTLFNSTGYDSTRSIAIESEMTLS